MNDTRACTLTRNGEHSHDGYTPSVDAKTLINKVILVTLDAG